MRRWILENRTRYSVIGTGYLVKIYDKNHPLYIKLKSIPHVDFKEYLFNLRSFESLCLKDENGRTYKSFFEMTPSKSFNLYRPDAFSRLEIRLDGLKHKKIFFQNLVRTDYLFPPTYLLRESVLENEGLLILEDDKGRFGNTTTGRKFYDVEQLKFELMKIPETNEKFVKSIWMEEYELHFKKPDTLNFGIKAFLI